jgi:hypothetical protein
MCQNIWLYQGEQLRQTYGINNTQPEAQIGRQRAEFNYILTFAISQV